MNARVAAEIKKHFRIAEGFVYHVGGAKKWICNFCERTISGSATRLRAHLLASPGSGVSACLNVSEDVKNAIRAVEEEDPSNKRKEPPPSTGLSSSSSSRQPGIAVGFKRLDRTQAEVDEAVAAWLYVNGIPFNTVRCDEWKEMMQAISNYGPGYKPPSYHALRGPLLQTTKAKMERASDVWRNEGRRLTGFVLSSDGWEDATGKPLINILLSTPKGAHFVEAVNASGHSEDAEFISRLWMAQIHEIGPEHVSVLITDGAAVNPAAAKLVTAKYPHITWVHCTAHALDLAMEDFGKLPFFKDTCHSMRKTIEFINNHEHSHSMLLAKSPLKLLTPGDMRFYTEYIAATRFLQVKSALQEVAASADFKAWAEKQSYKAEAIGVEKLIMDEDLWTDIELMVELFKPIVDLLRLVNSNLPTMGKVYNSCSLIDAHMANLSSPRFTADMKTEVRRLYRQRWDQLISPLHHAAYALDPVFQDCKLIPEVMRGLRQACKLILGDADAAKAAMLGHAAYVGKEGDFGDPMVIELAKDMLSYQWWVMHGGDFPELQRVAIRLLAMVSSARACERRWSAHEFVHSKERNRLDPDRAGDLVYVFTNMRLQKKAQKSEAFSEWNSGEEETHEEREVVQG